MLRVTVEFLHGTFRGTGADDAALAGQTGIESEWPPSPARLFQALVAGGGTGDRCTSPAGISDVRLLEGKAPTIHADHGLSVAATELLDRFAVIDKTEDGAVQNYPAREGAVSTSEWPRRCRRAPRSPTSGMTPHRPIWNSTDFAIVLPGSAISAVPTVQFESGWKRRHFENAAPMRIWSPGERGDTELGIPRHGWLEVLDAAYLDWVAGAPRRRSWIDTEQQRYRSPAPVIRSMGGQAIWVRFERAIRPRLVLTVADALKNAVLERYTALVADGDRDRVPAALHGHHPDGTTGHQHIHWLPLPFVGEPNADGRIRGACIWVPESATDLVSDLRVVVGSIRELAVTGVFATAVGTNLDNRVASRATSSSSRWSKPSRQWVSAFPVVQERRVRGEIQLDDVSMWSRHVGLPAPTKARWSRVPLMPGAAKLHAADVFRRNEDRRPFGHLWIEFAEAVSGPIALGRGRQFGLGLMLPVDLPRGEEGQRP